MTDQHHSPLPEASTTSAQPLFVQPSVGLDYPAQPAHVMSLSRNDYASWDKRVRARLIDQIPTYLGLIIFYVGYLILIVQLMVSDGSTFNFEGALSR